MNDKGARSHNPQIYTYMFSSIRSDLPENSNLANTFIFSRSRFYNLSPSLAASVYKHFQTCSICMGVGLSVFSLVDLRFFCLSEGHYTLIDFLLFIVLIQHFQVYIHSCIPFALLINFKTYAQYVAFLSYKQNRCNSY
jgi:hypothetical protein